MKFDEWQNAHSHTPSSSKTTDKTELTKLLNSYDDDINIKHSDLLVLRKKKFQNNSNDKARTKIPTPIPSTFNTISNDIKETDNLSSNHEMVYFISYNNPSKF